MSEKESSEASGRVEALWLKRAQRGPMQAADSVRFAAGKGIDKDANFGKRRRQVTIIEKEVFDGIIAKLPDVEPYMRRANVMVSGIALEGTRGSVLTVGGVRIRLYGETRPCKRMDAQVKGLTKALEKNWKGGVFGVVLDDGEVSVGDEASLESPGGD